MNDDARAVDQQVLNESLTRLEKNQQQLVHALSMCWKYTHWIIDSICSK
jgi:hypothetical protein